MSYVGIFGRVALQQKMVFKGEGGGGGATATLPDAIFVNTAFDGGGTLTNGVELTQVLDPVTINQALDGTVATGDTLVVNGTTYEIQGFSYPSLDYTTTTGTVPGYDTLMIALGVPGSSTQSATLLAPADGTNIADITSITGPAPVVQTASIAEDQMVALYGTDETVTLASGGGGGGGGTAIYDFIITSLTDFPNAGDVLTTAGGDFVSVDDNVIAYPTGTNSGQPALVMGDTLTIGGVDYSITAVEGTYGQMDSLTGPGLAWKNATLELTDASGGKLYVMPQYDPAGDAEDLTRLTVSSTTNDGDISWSLPVSSMQSNDIVTITPDPADQTGGTTIINDVIQLDSGTIISESSTLLSGADMLGVEDGVTITTAGTDIAVGDTITTSTGTFTISGVQYVAGVAKDPAGATIGTEGLLHITVSDGGAATSGFLLHSDETGAAENIRSFEVSTITNTSAPASHFVTNDAVSLAKDTGPTPDGKVDGAETGETMNATAPYTDAQGDQITTGTDLIYGNGGNDIIDSSTGDDVIYGGLGDDTIATNTVGVHTMYGDAGNDTLNIEGGPDADIAYGGANDDTINFGGGTAYGGADADTFEATANADANTVGTNIYGGSTGTDNDTLTLGPGWSIQSHTVENDGNQGYTGTAIHTSGGELAFEDIENIVIDGTPWSPGLFDLTFPDAIISATNASDGANLVSGSDLLSVEDTLTFQTENNGYAKVGETVTIDGVEYTITGFNRFVGNFDQSGGAETNNVTVQEVTLSGAGPVKSVFLPGDVFGPIPDITDLDISGLTLNNDTQLTNNNWVNDQDVTLFSGPGPDGNVDGLEIGETMTLTAGGTAYTDAQGDQITTGDDIIYGNGGADDIYGAAGNDTIFGGTDDDTINGNDDNDTLYGDTGNDLIRGDFGDDIVYGGEGNDNTYGSAGDDIVYGGTGDDYVAGHGPYSYDGTESGNDTLFGGDGNDSLSGGGGTDILYGGANNDTLNLGFEGNTIDGTPFTSSNNQAYGGADEDIFYAGFDGDFTDGGSTGVDNDTLYLPAGWTIQTYTVENNGNQGFNGTAQNADGTRTMTFQDIEKIFIDGVEWTPPPTQDGVVDGAATGENMPLGYADAQGDVITTGNDVIYGNGGNDTIQSNTGDDVVYGGDGDDTIYATSGTNTLVGGETGETNGDTVSSTTSAAAATVSMTGDGAGTMTLIGNVSTFSEMENIETGNADDNVNLTGDTTGMTVTTNEGADVITTGAGADTVFGGSDADTINAGADDTVDGGSLGNDADTLNLPAGWTLQSWTVENNGAQGFSGTAQSADGTQTMTFTDIESIVAGTVDITPDFIVEGTAGDDLINAAYTGDPEGDRVDSNDAADGSNDDLIYGFDGNDNIQTGVGNNVAYGGLGSDTITGGNGNDQLFGDAGDDLIADGSGDDVVYGGSGVDQFYAGNGNDVIYGGDSADLIQVTNTTGTNTVFGGETSGGGGKQISPDFDTLQFYEVFGGTGGTPSDATVTLSGDEAGSLTSTGGAATNFEGIERIVTAGGNDVVNASADTTGLTIETGAGADTITGGSGRDVIDGGNDADIIYAGVTDAVDGGSFGDDNDTLHLTGNWDITSWTAETNGNAGYNGTATNTDTNQTMTFTDIESIRINGTEWTPPPGPDGVVDGAETGENMPLGYADGQGDLITTGDDLIYGNGGNDVITGDAGNDDIYGGTGDDELAGGAGTDNVYGDAGNDTITIGGGTAGDVGYGGSDEDIFYAGVNDDVFGGSTGSDNDTLHLTGNWDITSWTAETNGNAGYNGTATNTDTNETMTFNDIENININGTPWSPTQTIDIYDVIIVSGPVAEGDILDTGSELVSVTDNASVTIPSSSSAVSDGDTMTVNGVEYTVTDISQITVATGTYDNGATTGTFSGTGLVTLTDASGNVITALIHNDQNGPRPDITQIEVTTIGEVVGVGVTRYDDNDDVTLAGPVTPDGNVDGEEIGETMTITSGAGGTAYDDAAGATNGGGDTITTGADVIYGNGGDDTIDGAAGDDTVYGGLGNDTILESDGADIVYGDDGDDTFDISANGDKGFAYGGADQDTFNVAVTTATAPTAEEVQKAEENAASARKEADAADADATKQETEAANQLASLQKQEAALKEQQTKAAELQKQADADDATATKLEADATAKRAESDRLNSDKTATDEQRKLANEEATQAEADAATARKIADQSQFDADSATKEAAVAESNYKTAEADYQKVLASATESRTLADQKEADAVAAEDDAAAAKAGLQVDCVDGGSTGVDLDTLNLPAGWTITSYTAETNGNPGYDGVATGPNGATLNFTDIEKIFIDGTEWTPKGPDGAVDGEEIGELMTLTSDGGSNPYDDGKGATDGGGDVLTTGDDIVYGNGGDDTIDAGQGNDTVYGGADNDTITDVSGDDIVYGDQGNDNIETGNGQDIVYGGADEDTINGGSDVDTIFGGTGSDVIDGSGDGFADVLYGGDDADTIKVDGGDRVFGGSGGKDDDTLDVPDIRCIRNLVKDPEGNGYNGEIHWMDGKGTMQVVVFDNIENLTVNGQPAMWPDYIVEGTGGADVINGGYTGDPEGDMIDAEDNQFCNNDDLVEAYGGDDIINSGDGNDTIFAGEGNDDAFGGDHNDTIYGEDGNDFLSGDAGNDQLFGGIGNDKLIGGDGDDSIAGEAGNDLLNGDAGNDELAGGTGEDYIYGGTGEDTIKGGADNDTIFGGADNDTINGNDGDDQIEGGDGDDMIMGDAGNDVLDGGAGNDTIKGGDDDDLMFGGDGNDDLWGELGNDTGYGGAGDDNIDLLDGDDIGIGGEGNDDIFGGAGNDCLYGDEPSNVSMGGGAAQGAGTGGSTSGAIADMPAADFTFEVQLNGTPVPTPATVAGVDDDNNPATPNVAPDPLPTESTTILSYGTAGQPGAFEIVAESDVEFFNYPQPNADTSTSTIGGNIVINYVDTNGVTQSFNTGIESALLLNGTDNSLGVSMASDGTLQIFIDGALVSQQTLPDGPNLPAGGDLTIGNNANGDNGFSGEISDVRLWDDIRSEQEINEFHNVELGDEAGDPNLVSNWTPNPFSNGGFIDPVGGNNSTGFGDATFNSTGNDGDDYIEGEDGDDKIIGAGGNDTLDGGAGNDMISGGTGDDQIIADEGDDELFAGDGDDTVYAGLGNDNIYAGDGSDLVFGDSGNDTIYAGPGDTVYGGGAGDAAADDCDTLDVSSFIEPGGTASFAGPLVADGGNGNGFNGTIEFFDAAGNSTGTLTFEDIEKFTGVPCFTPGTMIKTKRGETPVEQLQVGDKVLTRDNGYQSIQWIGTKVVAGEDLAQAPNLQPVMIRKGALGDNLPERDMKVSPQHRMLIGSPETELWFGSEEVLVAAKHMTVMDGVDDCEDADVTYIHVMFDAHEIICANGSWTESFQPGDLTLGGLDDDARAELLALFPELANGNAEQNYPAARPSLKAHEVPLILAAE